MRLFIKQINPQILGFNPRICKRCDFHNANGKRFHQRFNPRICKRCDETGRQAINATIVSIHASVKDATPNLIFHNCQLLSFNPRICKRCDKSQFYIRQRQICFNPRICKRCDLHLSAFACMLSVSIHASVKDAT